ncbi:MAG: nucleoside hydrolase [Planctomycetia bacterium]|nr:nucleoside hydrolase [Planctomycetia bacterium]
MPGFMENAPRKVILDVDPGIDDALTLCLALFDPKIEVVALTSVGGNAPASLSAKNLQGIVEFLDPPKLPRIGIGDESIDGLKIDNRSIHGIDGLGDAIPLPVAERCSQHPAEKIICDAVRQYPHDVSILALGPLTNIARAFQRDPEIPTLVDRLFIAGGTYLASGNITPTAEFNIFCDPKSAKYVFQSLCTKTLIPLDVSNCLKFSFEHLSKLPGEETKFGSFLYGMLLPAFRAYRRHYGMEQIYLQELVAYFFMTHPELFKTQEAAGDVETEGTLTRGMTVFDRRKVPKWRMNMEVVQQMNVEAVLEKIICGFNQTAHSFQTK